MISMIVIADKLSDSSLKSMEKYFSINFKKLSRDAYYAINSDNKLKLIHYNDFFKIEIYDTVSNPSASEQKYLVSQFINKEFKGEIMGIYFDEGTLIPNDFSNLLSEERRALIVN
ncbi:hypothetical protein GCM10008014_24920 [Paenibacillus silvae]|uniref:Uncharacterized protein n=1 Tax=Paenibacillus silvae TaxID=1325358 RepID=A0ABQ1ZD36_9BACL|nr:hypothetical protein [Paenibacillus silvae]GGH55369.1 hypothetical protein GCM10008014_24920 [Paenibacillus silvae]